MRSRRPSPRPQAFCIAKVTCDLWVTRMRSTSLLECCGTSTTRWMAAQETQFQWSGFVLVVEERDTWSNVNARQ